MVATPALAARITGAGHWHINADEPEAFDHRSGFAASGRSGPWRVSDHDPLLVGLGWQPRPKAAREANRAPASASRQGAAALAALPR